MPINRERLLERFLRYVRVDTTAVEGSGTYPSSPGQLELGRMLLVELQQLGLADAEQDAHGIIMATLPSNVAGRPPVVALCSHVDTSPETTGRNVRPEVIRDYAGGDIRLGESGLTIRTATCPELNDAIGHTLVTSDGTTLLGGDDKAGIAVIMEAVAQLVETPSLPHGPLRICFTCDEEIGHGVDHIDLAKLGAAVCYTLDGQGANEIDVETFSADLALVHIHGVNIHPSIAKGRMVNAVRVAAAFVDQMPRDVRSPEATADRQGFLHPYVVSGGVGEVTLRVLLRDFDTAVLTQHADELRAIATRVAADFPGSAIDIEVQPQYRNLADGLAREPRAAALAEEALRRLGREPRRTIVRGGTDGSRLTEIGLPTPNLSTGQHQPHSPLEWASLDEMAAAAEMLVTLAGVWTEQTG
ncbi:MAG: peptidase T [Planctomycetia bacterium]|nr:peptidase T [Planctomycetia bacterium]